jgi:hypothetical protein
VAVRVAGASKVRILDGGYDRLVQSRLGPVGQDLQRRGLRVVRRMKENVSGRPGPNIRTRNLYESIGFLAFGLDGQGLFADIGAQPHRTIRRGWNYPLILEGKIGDGRGVYPWAARSLDAARD